MSVHNRVCLGRYLKRVCHLHKQPEGGRHGHTFIPAIVVRARVHQEFLTEKVNRPFIDERNPFSTEIVDLECSPPCAPPHRKREDHYQG